MTASIVGMELVVKIDGGVQETNLEDFEKVALSVIDNIKTDLQTDDDFAVAEATVKDCKIVEGRIADVKQNAMHGIDDISALFTVMDKLSDKFRATRLDLEKKVKSEKADRKKEVVSAGMQEVADIIFTSSVQHATFAYAVDINDAIKGKKSIEKMREAVTEIVDWYKDHVFDMSELFDSNIDKITLAEKEYPDLFHDKKQVALKTSDEVEAVIDSRINDFKLKQIEKREAERKAREEAERKAKETADRITAKSSPEEKPMSKAVPTFDDFPTMESEPVKSCTITLQVSGTESDISHLVTSLSQNPIVTLVNKGFAYGEKVTV